MNRFLSRCLALVAAVLVCSEAPLYADLVVDFDDPSPPLPRVLGPEDHWQGPDPAGADRTVIEWWGSYTQRVGSFTSRGTTFSNKYNLDFGSWSDWAYSNVTDNTTPDYANQYSAFAGTGHGPGNDNYGMAYGSTINPNYGPDDVPSITLPSGAGTLAGAYFTNATYPALVMRDGDVNHFSKQFGGPSGDDPDWLLLTVKGIDQNDQVMSDQVDFYLADYRFGDNAQDYIVDDWTWVDLSPLAGAKQLFFNLTSSDTDPVFGMNTPAYFAMDDLTFTTAASAVPEPSAWLLLLVGIGGVALWRRRGRSR